LNLRNSTRKVCSSRRKALALPMTLVILLFGSVLVATALYVVQNMYSTSRHSVTHTQLYNAAQSGIEQAKSLLWEKREELDTNEREYDGNINTVRARLEGASTGSYLDDALQGMTVPELPGVTVSVDILDCNYIFHGVTYETLSATQIASLPPRWPGGETGGGTGGVEGPPEGTSVIIDPSRFFNLGGGLPGQRRMVIRSTASENGGMKVTIEVMVVVTQ